MVATIFLQTKIWIFICFNHIKVQILLNYNAKRKRNSMCLYFCLSCLGWIPGSSRPTRWRWTPSNRTAPRSFTRSTSPTTQTRYAAGTPLPTKEQYNKKKKDQLSESIMLTLVALLPVQIFEVATSTRIRDLIQNISKKLKLASADGFSLFVKTQDKVHPSFSDHP